MNQIDVSGEPVSYVIESRMSLHLGDLFNAGEDSFPTVDVGAGGSLTGLVEALEMGQ